MRNLTRALALSSSALMLLAAPFAVAQSGSLLKPPPAEQDVQPGLTPIPDPQLPPLPNALPQPGSPEDVTVVDSSDGGGTETPDAPATGDSDTSDPAVEPKG